MSDLIAFLAARLDEDEVTAKADAPNRPRYPLTIIEARLIARHDPARALREVEAKWRIVRDYEISARACRNVTGSELDSPGYASMRGGRDALRAACLALTWAYSDHPDYRQEWAP